MKSLFTCALLALVLGGCTSESPSLRIVGARGFEDDCEAGEFEQYIPSGSIDVGLRDIPGAPPEFKNYPMFFSVESNYGEGAPGLDVNGQPLRGDEAFDITIESYELSYDSELSLPDQTVPYYAVFRGNTDPEDSNILPYLLTPEVYEELLAQATPEPTVVRVGVRLKGKTTSGAAVESNEAVFPLTVTNTAGTCPAGTFPTVTFCGGTGYNGAGLVCG